MKKYKNLQWLKKNYIIDDLTDKEIANLCNVSSRTIRWWREKFRIIKKRKCGIKIKELRTRVTHSFYKNLLAYCDYKKISISSAIRIALLELLIKNKFNPYKK